MNWEKNCSEQANFELFSRTFNKIGLNPKSLHKEIGKMNRFVVSYLFEYNMSGHFEWARNKLDESFQKTDSVHWTPYSYGDILAEKTYCVTHIGKLLPFLINWVRNIIFLKMFVDRPSNQRCLIIRTQTKH